MHLLPTSHRPARHRYTALAHAACATMRRTVWDNHADLTWIGGFAGWGGVLYTLTHLAALWQQPQLLEEAQEKRGWRCGTPTEVESPGLMTGLAGISYGLLRLAAPARVPAVLTLEGPRGAQDALG